MTADDRGATVPEAHIDAVATLLDNRELCPHERAWQEREGVYVGCDRCEVVAVLSSTDPAVLDALAWAVTRTPEGRDKVLAALVEAERATERWAKP